MILSHHQKTVFSVILTVIITVIAMYDTVFHLLLELMHISFELVEQSLDLLVEHIFHTDRRETQIIVFYIMVAIACYGAYRLLRAMPRCCRKCREHLATGWLRLKLESLAYWQALSPTGKAKWWLGGITSVSGMILWLFM